MRKPLLLITIILGLTLTLLYLLSSTPARDSNTVKINCNINIVTRFLMDENKWKTWWPGVVKYDSATNKNEFDYQGYKYLVKEYKYNLINIQTVTKNFKLDGSILFVQLSADSVFLEWKYSLPIISNPIKRFLLYREAKKVHSNAMNIIKNLKTILENQVNVYGVKFHEKMSSDSTLVAIRSTTRHYPSSNDIYSLVAKLRKYINEQGAKEYNFPMLNVKKISDSTFEYMVALPVNKFLPGNGEILHKRYVPWKVLMAEVNGGSYTVENALKEMNIYMSDYQKKTMALPFQSLVTDRSKQPDTLKWITRIYTPIP
ncbi:MAG: hypothetical protein ABI091_25875 [Ferruginibacter sp.]